MVWFGQLLDPLKRKFLKFSKIRNSRNSQNSVSKTIFFLGKLYQQIFCFALSLHGWNSIRLVWFGQLLDPLRNFYSLNSQKFAILKIREIPYENPTFFSWARSNKLCFTLSLHRVWFDLDNSLTRWKKPIFKIPFSRNSKSSVWKPNFFPRQAKPKILFAFYSHYTGDTPYRVCFDLDNSLTRWKRPIFKIHFSRNSKSSVWKTKFFPRQAKPKILFAFYSHCTGDTPYRFCFDLDNSLTRWKRPIFKIPFSRNSKSSVWKTKFFPKQAEPKILFALYSHYTGDTPYRVCFDLDNSLTRWKKLIFKIPFSRNSKSSVWKPNFFPKQAKPKIFFASYSH